MKINPNNIIKPSINLKNSTESVGKGEENITKAVSPKDKLDDLIKAYGEKELKRIGALECATCASRTYVDGSDDPGVSFKSPGKIDPDIAASVVMSHELEHVSNEQADAKAKGREVISQSVTLSTAICSECGRSYVSGGTTRTTTKGKSEYEPSSELLMGLKVDKKI